MRSVLENSIGIMYVYQTGNGLNKSHTDDDRKKAEASKKNEDDKFSELLAASIKTFK